jgi:DNA-binding MarR family transcriptional regulator
MEPDWIDRMVERLDKLMPRSPSDAYQVTGRISRIAARLAQREEELFGRYGLNRGEVGVLGALRTSGPPHTASPTQLFRGLMLSSAGMTSRLDRLERRGLVRRKPDPTDRRGILVDLTPEGRKLVDRVITANTKSEADLLETLSREEKDLLAAAMRKLLRVLEPPGGG